MVYGVDFESYYDDVLSISVMGVDAYLAHPDVDIYLVSIVGEGVHYCGPVEDAPWDEVSGHDFVAHNARFDETVFAEAQKRGLISTDITYGEWFCTADMSVYLGGPRALKSACSVLLDDVEVSKEYRVVAKGKHGKDFSEEDMKIIVDAGFGDAESCLELWETHNHRWPESERAISKSNREATRNGCNIDVEALDAAIKKLAVSLWEYGNQIPWDWSDNKTPTSGKKIRAHCRAVGIPSPSSFAEDSEECEEWEEQYSEKYPWIDAIRQWRKANSLHGKLLRIQSRLREDPVTGAGTSNFPYTIKYFGAHTGRFSGDGGFNMQNIYSKEREGINVRHMFIPRPGKKLFIVDYAQIESRVLLWLVSDSAALDLVRAGISVYEAHAAKTMGYDSSLGSMKVQDPQGYKLAKARVLGLGFGCGAKTFQKVARNLTGLIITQDEAQQIVWDYRASNKPVTSFWRRLDAQLSAAVRSEGRTLRLQLPSTRVLNYYNVATLDRGTTVQPGLDANRTFTWGGKLCFGAETLVLTSRGAIPIVAVTQTDKVWDGENWVPTKGPIQRGNQEIGRWLTIPVTAGHKITDGNSWRNVTDADEEFSLDALKWVQDSVSLPSFSEGLETPRRLPPRVHAEQNTKLLLGLCSEGKLHSVQAAGTGLGGVNVSDTARYSLPKTSNVYGVTGSQGWFLGVITRITKRILTMAGGVFQFTSLGSKIGSSSSSTPRHLKTGMSSDLTLTGSTTTAGMYPTTYGSVPERRTATIEGPQWKWLPTKEKMPVFDLFECGPNHRYTIVTPFGPVVVHNCENVVQATARDVMIDGWLRVLEAYQNPDELRLLFHVHDEFVFEVDEGFDTTPVIDILEKSPAWATTLPLGVEAELTDHYKK